jgi:hypothetical protein
MNLRNLLRPFTHRLKSARQPSLWTLIKSEMKSLRLSLLKGRLGSSAQSLRGASWRRHNNNLNNRGALFWQAHSHLGLQELHRQWLAINLLTALTLSVKQTHLSWVLHTTMFVSTGTPFPLNLIMLSFRIRPFRRIHPFTAPHMLIHITYLQAPLESLLRDLHQHHTLYWDRNRLYDNK